MKEGWKMHVLKRAETAIETRGRGSVRILATFLDGPV
jgi:hypothetical protein